MGAALCMLCFPVGGMAGCCSAACNFWGCFQTAPWPGLECYRRNWTVPATFAITFVAALVLLYLPLTILCANADNHSWKFFPDGRECASEGGEGKYDLLGMVAGLIMGASLAGCIVTTMAILWCGRGRYISANGDGDNGATAATATADLVTDPKDTAGKEAAKIADAA